MGAVMGGVIAISVWVIGELVFLDDMDQGWMG